MLLFAAPLYFIAFIGWVLYAALIKKDIRQNMSMVYFGSTFALIWMLIFVVAL